MMRMDSRRITTIVFIVIIVIAIIVIIVLLMRANGVQPFKRMSQTKVAPPLQEAKKTNKEKLRNDVFNKQALGNDTKASQSTKLSATDERLEAAQVNRNLNTKKKHSKKRSSSINKPNKPSTLRTGEDEVPVVLTGETVWDLLTPKEDTMREYGVTEDELNRLVDEYREEHTYKVEKAPTTINFDMEKWDRATDIMQESMKHSVVERKPYEDGLIDALYKEGEL